MTQVNDAYKSGWCGVWPFLLDDDHPFDPACAAHDAAYATHDWTQTTLQIDQEFYQSCMIIAGTDTKLQAEAKAFYKLCRTWGTMRFYLAKVGIVWATQSCTTKSADCKKKHRGLKKFARRGLKLASRFVKEI